jgi:flagellar biogenesis protein FliO
MLALLLAGAPGGAQEEAADELRGDSVAETAGSPAVDTAGLPQPTALTPEQLESDTPPPSTYDRTQRNGEPIPEERSLSEQLVRTLFALAVVIALIYLVFKLGLGKLLRGGAAFVAPSRGERRLEVLERLQLDPKSALYVVAVGSERQLLLGSGEHGLSYLCDVADTNEPNEAKGPEFSSYMKATSSDGAREDDEGGDVRETD